MKRRRKIREFGCIVLSENRWKRKSCPKIKFRYESSSLPFLASSLGNMY